MGETADSHADIAALARRVAAHPDYRVLRRLAPVARFHDPDDTTPTTLRIGAVVDVETTGLDRASDRIIELAVQRFRFCPGGRIVEVGQPRVWREDPGQPLAPEIMRLTGLTDADVSGQAIDDARAIQLLGSADVIVAHNASFDRPFVERRLPAIAGRAWACSMRDIGWATFGFEGRSLSHLSAQCGWFYAAHRAENDVLAVLHLLAHALPSGDTVLRHMIATAEQPTWRVHAVDSPFGSKELLKARGYRWNAELRFWWRELPQAELFAERAWLSSEIYTGWGEPKLQEITWLERYS